MNIINNHTSSEIFGLIDRGAKVYCLLPKGHFQIRYTQLRKLPLSEAQARRLRKGIPIFNRDGFGGDFSDLDVHLEGDELAPPMDSLTLPFQGHRDDVIAVQLSVKDAIGVLLGGGARVCDFGDSCLIQDKSAVSDVDAIREVQYEHGCQVCLKDENIPPSLTPVFEVHVDRKDLFIRMPPSLVVETKADGAVEGRESIAPGWMDDAKITLMSGLNAPLNWLWDARAKMFTRFNLDESDREVQQSFVEELFERTSIKAVKGRVRRDLEKFLFTHFKGEDKLCPDMIGGDYYARFHDRQELSLGLKMIFALKHLWNASKGKDFTSQDLASLVIRCGFSGCTASQVVNVIVDGRVNAAARRKQVMVNAARDISIEAAKARNKSGLAAVVRRKESGGEDPGEPGGGLHSTI